MNNLAYADDKNGDEFIDNAITILEVLKSKKGG